MNLPSDIFQLIIRFTWEKRIRASFFAQQLELAIDARESIPDFLKMEWMFTGNSIVENPNLNFAPFVPCNHMRIGFNQVLYDLFLDMSERFYTRNHLYKGVVLKKIRLLALDIRNLHYWNDIVILCQFIEITDVQVKHLRRVKSLCQSAEPLRKSSLGLKPFSL